MRNQFLVAALGFLVGAATLAGGEEDDWELERGLRRLQEAMARLRMTTPAQPGKMPALNESGYELALFPVFDLTCGRRDFIPPEHRLMTTDSETYFFGRSEEAPQPLGTLEEVMELVRTSVMPRAWDTAGAVISASGQTLFVMNSPAVIEGVGQFLDARVRPAAHRCVTVETKIVEVPAGLYRDLGRGAGTALTEEQRGGLEQALASEAARRVFTARATTFAGQRCVFWHGRQVAVVPEADVKIAQNSASPDPLVQVVQAGGFLDVRPSIGEDEGRLTLDGHVRLDELERLDTGDVGDAGQVDLPRVRSTAARTSLTIPNRTWAVFGAGTPRDGRVRLVLVRATYLPRGGGR